MGYGGEENTEAALGGGWERDSGDEETGGPVLTSPGPCQLSQIYILLPWDSLQ